MSILPINVYGDTILRKKARKVNDVDGKTVEFIKNMFESMHNASGIGLAANQVGSGKSIFVVDVSTVEGYEKVKPIVFINPEILLNSEEKILMEEGCLSLPYLRAEVERPKIIQVKYFDTDLKEHTLEADKLLARVIQHEYDHLKGIMFVDRIPEEEKNEFKPELKKIRKRKIDADYPIAKPQKVKAY
jgi:peptide deformylase